MRRLATLPLCTALCAMLVAACGTPAPAADAAPNRRTLRIIAPAGAELGLAYGQAGDLRVLYTDAAGSPVAGETLHFAITTDPANPNEGPAGSSLSASAATTDDDGTAVVQVIAGAARASFHVEASGLAAQPQKILVVVANEGFAQLRVTPRHSGWRPPDDLARIEVRLYRFHGCADVDPGSPPPPIYPILEASGFGVPVEFHTVGAAEAHAALGVGFAEGGHVLALGCVQLQEGQIRAGATIDLDVVVADRAVSAAPSYAVTSVVDLTPVRDAVLAAGSAWRIAACPLGAAQLVLDGALASSDSPGEERAQVEAARGAADDNGCRPKTGPAGKETPDAAVMKVLSGPVGATPGAWLGKGSAGLASLLTKLVVRSRLVTEGAFASHLVETLALEAAGTPFVTEATTSARPIIVASSVPLIADGDRLTIERHGFTLRLGWLLADAFSERLLAAAGLAPSIETLGTTVIAAATDGVRAGCDAISQAACAAVGAKGTCLVRGCIDSSAGLDRALAEPFARLLADGLDVAWQGVASMTDADGDLVAEALVGGLWSAEILLADESTVDVAGSFAGQKEL